MPTWMIYGANGYMGELIAREAKARGTQRETEQDSSL